MNIKETIKRLGELDSCGDEKWLETQPDVKTAWKNCERGDWMLWVIGRMSGPPESDSRKKLVLCACKCARLASKHVPDGEKRPLKAIETAEKWANGEAGVTLKNVRASASASYTASSSADDDADASYTAADSAYAAASAAASAADASAASVSRLSELKKYADIVREMYPEAPSLESSHE